MAKSSLANKKKTVSTKQSLTATGAIGTFFSTMVPALISNEQWQTVSYAAVPIIASLIVYFGSKFINTRESLENSALRANLNRDLKFIDKQLKNKNITEALKKELEDDRHIVIMSLGRIGRGLNAKQVV